MFLYFDHSFLFSPPHPKSIIFIRDRNARGQEVSAYIDFAHRLKVDEFEVYFSGKKKLFPRRSDLRSISHFLPFIVKGRQLVQTPHQHLWKNEGFLEICISFNWTQINHFYYVECVKILQPLYMNRLGEGAPSASQRSFTSISSI